ncbi:MAG: NADP-dependent oxidoreductase [Bacteroidales bacterium]
MSKAFILKSRPVGKPVLADFEEVEVADLPLEEGQLLLEGKFYSVDPYMRGRMSDQKSYIPPFEVGQPLAGGVVAKVLESRAEGIHPGDYVLGMMLKWQTVQAVWANEVQKIDVQLAPPSYYLGLLGLTGLTAYFGLTRIGKPKPAETVVISGAAGAVGIAVGQIAKIMGCNVIGVAGHKSKLTYLKEDLGFDAALDYHDLDKLEKDLHKAAPLGVDIYFDNVGGELSDRILKQINHGARIIICGQIALYNETSKAVGPYPQVPLLINSALMKGFIVSDYVDSFHEGQMQLIKWYREGLLKGKETVVIGFDKLPQTFIDLFDGKNTGKMIVQA